MAQPPESTGAIVAGDLVTTKFNQAANYASSAWSTATTFINSLMSVGEYVLTPTTTTIEVPDGVPSAPNIPSPPAAPDLTMRDFDVPTLTGLLSTEELAIEAMVVPDFPYVMPEISIPNAPEPDWPTSPGSSPSLGVVSVPTAPSITLPTVPTLGEITIPTVPDIASVSFDGVRPTDNIEPPGSLFVYSSPAYTSSLRTALQEKMVADLAAGGTGLGSTVEAQIWANARARLEEQRVDAVQEAEDFFAARGWSMPTGVLSSRITKINTEYARELTKLNNEIAIEQARLAKEQSQFIVQQAIQFETLELETFNSVSNRTFEAAKYVAEYGIALYGAKVNHFQAQLSQYQVDAQVMESMLRVNLADLEAFKVQMEGARLEADIQGRLVDLYNARLNGVQALIDVYKSELEGAGLRADLEQKKLDAFRLSVEIYVAQIGAQTSRFNAYAAQIGGEEAKARIYAEQTRAYLGKVEALKAKSSVDIERVRALVEQNNVTVNGYRARVDAVKAQIEEYLAEIRAQAELYGIQVNAYDAQTKGLISQSDVETRIYAAQTDSFIKEAELRLKEATANLELAISARQVQVEAIKGGAQVSAQLAASALNSVNASAQYGFSGHVGDSYSNSYSESESVSVSTYISQTE